MYERYQRQLLLPQVGLSGQTRLQQAKVLCIGAGGLGSPVMLYLAGAGVGTLGIVDHDRVELSNLQRQIIYTSHDVGQKKVIAAKQRLIQFNPEIEIITHDTKIMHDNALALLALYDIVVDGTDNFAARYLINDACHYLKKPLISASIFQFEGQCSAFMMQHGPCYRCLYAYPPPNHFMPTCTDAGVLGVLPGLLGSIQATEVIKIILKMGQSLSGRLLTVDALSLQFREFQLEQSKDCPLCSQEHSFFTLTHDEEKYCMNTMEEITVQELLELRNQHAHFTLLDVREVVEYDTYNLGGTLIPLGQLPERINELDREQLIIVHCKSGGRSSRAVEFLKKAGFNAKNLKGGANAWRTEIEKKSAL